jgi:hypothetical protein
VEMLGLYYFEGFDLLRGYNCSCHTNVIGIFVYFLDLNEGFAGVGLGSHVVAMLCIQEL